MTPLLGGDVLSAQSQDGQPHPLSWRHSLEEQPILQSLRPFPILIRAGGPISAPQWSLWPSRVLGMGQLVRNDGQGSGAPFSLSLGQAILWVP